MNLTILRKQSRPQASQDRAVEEDTSVNAVLRDCLEAYAGGRGRNHQAVRRLLFLAENSGSGRGAATWTRDELHGR